MNALERLKQLQQEVGQTVSEVEAEEKGTAVPPTEYSSSVSSVTVDPETGDVSISIILYPGDTPISPPPVEVPAETEREAPEVQIAGGASTTEVVPPDEDQPQPGFTPAE